MPFFTKYFVLLLRHTKTRILVCGDIPIQVYNMAIRAEKTTAGSRATFRITARVAPAGGTQGFPPIGEQRGSAVQGHSANRSKPRAGSRLQNRPRRIYSVHCTHSDDQSLFFMEILKGGGGNRRVLEISPQELRVWKWTFRYVTYTSACPPPKEKEMGRYPDNKENKILCNRWEHYVQYLTDVPRFLIGCVIQHYAPVVGWGGGGGEDKMNYVY
jgi:hypothetical protein